MGYEAVRGTGRRGKLGGTSVRGYTRFRDRRAPAPRNRSMYFPGHRGGSADPILWVGAVALGTVVFILAALIVTHLHSSPGPEDTAPVVHAPAAPVAPQLIQPTEAPAPPCYPFQASC